MRRALRGLWVLGLLACSGGASPPPGDAGGDAAVDQGVTAPDVGVDAGPLDAGPVEAPPVAPFTCQPCLRDETCGLDGLCVEVDRMRAPGFRECRAVCSELGAPCEAAVPSTCREGPRGALLCTPDTAFSCVVTGSRRGDRCPEAGCSGRYTECADLRDPSLSVGRSDFLCTARCARDEDCEDGARRCRTVQNRAGARVQVCIPDDRIGPEACGAARVNTRGVGAPCDAMTPCAAGLSCLEGLDPAVRGFCSAACTDAASCGGGPVGCVPVGSLGSRCVPNECGCLGSEAGSALDRALGAEPGAPFSRCNLFFPSAALDIFGSNVSRDRYRLPLFDRVHRDWLAGARFARGLGPQLDTGVGTLSAALARTASLRLGARVDALEVPSPRVASGGHDALLRALEALQRRGGATPDAAALSREVMGLPASLAGALAAVLEVARETLDARDAGLIAAPDAVARERLFRIAPNTFLPSNRLNDRPDFTQVDDLVMFRDTVRLPTAEALRLAATVEAVAWSTWRGAMGPSLNVDTPAGRVVVRDAADHRYDAADFPRTLVVIDLGGSDTYLAPVAANQDVDNGVSVLVDLAGDDRYGYPEVPSPLDTPETLASDADGRARSGAGSPSMSRTARQGAGRLGVGLLYDLGQGRDQYRSLRMSQGFGALGVGGLFDDGGADTYSVEAAGQGAAVGGVGVLVDLGAEADRYTTWAFAQGYGYVQGAGLLYDRGGDDVYDSKVTPMLYPSAQSPTTNSSFTQGAGFGRRGDAYPDRINMSGGLGILRDYAGSDRYTTSVFGQGTGYWGGMGLLLDGTGDDHYDGRWYVQGAAAHFAYGALVDGGGRDVHNATATRQNMTAGAGHDFSLGLLLALGPEGDRYGVPNLALGAGNANGAGLFFDEGGDDTYDAASALTLGNAALETLTDPGRLMRATVGIFLDTGGRDTYQRSPEAPLANDTRWFQRVHAEAPSERGFGVDGQHPAVGF